MKEMIDRTITQKVFEQMADEYNAAVDRNEGDEYMNALVMLLSGIFAAQETREQVMALSLAFTRALLKATKELREQAEGAAPEEEATLQSQVTMTGSFEA